MQANVTFLDRTVSAEENVRRMAEHNATLTLDAQQRLNNFNNISLSGNKQRYMALSVAIVAATLFVTIFGTPLMAGATFATIIWPAYKWHIEKGNIAIAERSLEDETQHVVFIYEQIRNFFLAKRLVKANWIWGVYQHNVQLSVEHNVIPNYDTGTGVQAVASRLDKIGTQYEQHSKEYPQWSYWAVEIHNKKHCADIIHSGLPRILQEGTAIFLRPNRSYLNIHIKNEGLGIHLSDFFVTV